MGQKWIYSDSEKRFAEPLFLFIASFFEASNYPMEYLEEVYPDSSQIVWVCKIFVKNQISESFRNDLFENNI